jgi:hypothetical protein
VLHTALGWISGGSIEKYMSAHQQNPNANELWTYFQNVINWVILTFGCPKNYRKEMRGIAWGALYDKYKGEMYDATKLEQEIATLMMDDDVTNKKGIYLYILSRDERALNLRAFTAAQKREAYERQSATCPGWVGIANVARIVRLTKCKQIILPRGAKEGKPFPKTVKCYVPIITVAKVAFSQFRAITAKRKSGVRLLCSLAASPCSLFQTSV